MIEHRQALVYMLCEAAELEHGIMYQYLFAALSLKQTTDEGLSETELEAVRRWRTQVARVATQEMLHLALVHNLLSDIGIATLSAAAPGASRAAAAGHQPARASGSSCCGWPPRTPAGATEGSMASWSGSAIGSRRPPSG